MAVLVFVIFSQIANGQIIPFAFFKKSTSTPADPCFRNTVQLERVCDGGAIYAGEFQSGKYMVTPSGCTDSAAPTCAGGIDSVTKTWKGSSGSFVDIAGVENISSTATASSLDFRGNVNTPAIVADPSTSSDSAADYCNDMSYGGYSDWFLPNKSELAYIYCHWDAPSHNTSYPNEDPNCTNYGGKTSELTGFASSDYWSSNEGISASSRGAEMSFSNGIQSTAATKHTSNRVRCVRRYDNDVTPGWNRLGKF